MTAARFWIVLLAVFLVALALVGWTVSGIRWAAQGPRRRRAALSPA